MKVFVAYKFADEDPQLIKDALSKVSGYLENLGIETFEFFRDVQKWGEESHSLSNRDIIELAFQKLADCDALLAVVSAKGKSGGMLLETGYAKALNKKIFLAISEEVRSDVDRFLSAVADNVVYYHQIEDLQQTLPDLLKA